MFESEGALAVDEDGLGAESPIMPAPPQILYHWGKSILNFGLTVVLLGLHACLPVQLLLQSGKFPLVDVAGAQGQHPHEDLILIVLSLSRHGWLLVPVDCVGDGVFEQDLAGLEF